MRGNSESFGYYFSVGVDILASTVDGKTNVVSVTLGDSTTGTVESSQATLLQHAGFTSVPAPPTSGATSCQAIVLRRGDSDIVIGTRDVRVASLYGNLKPGETSVYATSGMARTIYKANGAIVHYTTSDNTPNGTSVQCYIGPDAIRLGNQYGSFSLDANGATLTVGGAALTLTPAGIAKLLGQQVAVQGAIVAVSGTVGTFLGPAATPATHALYGSPGTPLASATVSISP